MNMSSTVRPCGSGCCGPGPYTLGAARAGGLGPVKAFRADDRGAPTPDGADGLDRPFERAAGWLLRDRPPTIDVKTHERAQLEAHELDALVAFVRILLEWDGRKHRTSTEPASKGAERDGRQPEARRSGRGCTKKPNRDTGLRVHRSARSTRTAPSIVEVSVLLQKAIRPVCAHDRLKSAFALRATADNLSRVELARVACQP